MQLMVEIKITSSYENAINFKEINPVFREDYEQMGNTPGMGGVGF